MPADSNTSPAPLSKEARKSCHSARDAFYACVREQGVEFAPGTKPPARCTSLRQQFEGACPASWVKHFDDLQEANIRRAKYLAATIGRASGNAAGSLEGKAQQ